MIELMKGIYAEGKSVWIPKHKIMVIADVHLGYEEMLNRQGVLVPRTQFLQTKKELQELCGKLHPGTIIINGDFKHEFGGISSQEWQDAQDILDMLLRSSKVILIKGNHDTILEPIARKKGLAIVNYFCIGEICITHGDKIRTEKDAKDAKIIIMGNEHPAISIRDGIKSEKYKCFLAGTWKSKKLIVLPSFLSITTGSDIRQEERLSPYLQQNLSRFGVFIVGDNEIYDFGQVKELS